MDPKSSPAEESLGKPYPYSTQESEEQRSLAYSQQRPQSRERVSENPPNWLELAHLFTAKIQRVSIATVVTFLVAVAMEILKIFSVQKCKTREREEMKTKMKEIENKLKEIEDHKRKLDEQVFFFQFRRTFFFNFREIIDSLQSSTRVF